MVLVQSLEVLVSGQSQSLRLAWPLPFGSANMEIDPLSAVFAAAIALVTMLAAVYGSGYLQRTPGKRGQSPFAGTARRVLAQMGTVPFRQKSRRFLVLLQSADRQHVAGCRGAKRRVVPRQLGTYVALVVLPRDLEDEEESVRRAGWIYLVAMHLGTAFLLALFLLLGKNAGSLDFERLSTAAAPSGVFFLLAVIGFGTKAGFIPMHVWLPEAHPAAPSHVSAVMSGVMIKTGIYGLLRMLTLLGPPPPWWGWTFVVIGVVSGILGVLYALSQHDLKRLLAYHSVENIGIIAMGLGRRRSGDQL